MNTPRHLILGGLIVTALIAGCRTTDGPPPATAPTQPLTVLERFTGDAPDLAMDVYLIKSQAELEALGSRQVAALPVDFDRASLVIVALGEKDSDGYSVTIDGVQESGNQLFVQATLVSPGPDTPLSMDATFPFGAAVITKTHVQKVQLEPTYVTAEGGASE